MATEPADSPASGPTASAATAAGPAATSPRSAAATSSRSAAAPTAAHPTAATADGPAAAAQAAPQASPLGSHRAGVPAGVRARGGGRRLLDRLVAEPHPRAGRLPRTARRRQGHDLAAGRVRQPATPDARTAGRLTTGGESATVAPTPSCWFTPGFRIGRADHDGVDPAGLIRGDSRLRQRQDQRRVRAGRRPAAGADPRTGDRNSAEPLRRDRLRRFR